MPASEKLHILLVDDELEYLEITARALHRHGLDVKTAADGARALELVRHNNFDTIILDERMPGLNGSEVFQLIKQQNPDIPVIILTGHGTIKQAFEISRMGVFEYLTKPCDINKLVKVIHRACSDSKNEIAIENIKVLLVDDNQEFVSSLDRVLSHRGFKVSSSTNATAALELLAEQHFDVAILDLVMPEIGGLELLKQIKQQYQHIEVIMLTGHPSVQQAITGMDDGAFDFMVKPPAIETLIIQVRKAATSANAKLQTLMKLQNK
ncbi:MAG: response regulator [Deltaproteobacteria bacterium]|nr:response regulator [Deltaproteobacteria bacterium]